MTSFVVVAHRGIASLFPENTAPSLRAAASRRVDRVEFDVRLTADRRAVLHHDDTTYRLCGRARGGRVRDLDLDVLRRLTVRPRFRPRPPAGETTRLLSFDEALSIVRPEIPIEVELKGEPEDATALADAVWAALSRTGGLDRVRVTSAEPALLEAMRLHSAKLALGIVYHASPRLDLDAVVRSVGANGIVPNHRHARRDFVRHWHRRGLTVVPYTVNTRAVWRRVREAGVDGVVTDVPERIEAWERAKTRGRRSPTVAAGRRGLRESVEPARYLAIDLGSTSIKVAAADAAGRIVEIVSAPCPTRFGERGRVGVDAEALDRVTRRLATGVLRRAPDIDSLVIASQRSSFVLWEEEGGRLVGDAPSWRCSRGRAIVAARRDAAAMVHRRTGLRLDAAYSASKIAWKLRRASGSSVRCAPLSGYLLWKWSRGELHRTDPTLAARMLLMNLSDGQWDLDLCRLFGIDPAILPVIGPTFGELGRVELGGRTLDVRCEIGDQQGALAGIFDAREKGPRVALNLGTGAFLLAQTGSRRVRSRSLLSSVAWRGPRGSEYLMEGAIRAVAPTLESFAAENLRDRLGLAEAVARGGPGTWVLPAREGLASPYWDSRRRFVVRGRRHADSVARALYESIGFLVRDNWLAMRRAVGDVEELRVAGGLARDPHLLQAIADALALPLGVAPSPEATLEGALRLGLRAGGRSPRRRGSASPPAAHRGAKAPVRGIGDARIEPRVSVAEAARNHARWRHELRRSLRLNHLS